MDTLLNGTSASELAGLFREAIATSRTVQVRGKVLQVQGTIIRASVPEVKVGELCRLRNPEGPELLTEVVGLSPNAALLCPLGELRGLSSATEVIPTGDSLRVAVGPALLGRILDGLGRPIDTATRGPLISTGFYPVNAAPPDPLTRPIISKPLALGLRALDGLLTCGDGQRLGIFAPAGAGKSTLLAQIIRNCEAEVTVLALIGERGREVREYIEHDLGPEGMKKTVVVVATSDRPAMERLKAAYVATAVAEYFRDQGKRVMLLMDSVTRFARAQREIGLAAGEPPTRRGFPPSVFAELPRLMERAGTAPGGSITALYTVLVEGDDMTEPVADETRSILDGHIILSRKLASANNYPAIDVLRSVSRVMNALVTKEHLQNAQRLRELMSKHEDIELLLRIGEYKSGADADADEAVKKQDAIGAFLRQGLAETSTFAETVKKLAELTRKS